MANSPITGSKGILERSLSKEEIINSYKNVLQIDISYLFKDVSEIYLYRCPDTGYRYFFPFFISGDSLLYEHLQDKKWYYMPWKWEHQHVVTLLRPKMKVLELGCGKGSFLREIQQKKEVEASGLELNKKAAEQARNGGLTVFLESIKEHAEKNSETYDLVCSFQVLEHISEVNEFLMAQISSLRTGGKLVISVPNNESFIKYQSGGILNFPPHHMGWWSSSSLRQLENYYPIQLEEIQYEPLQVYHFEWFKSVWIQQKLKSKILKYLFYRLKLSKLFDFVLHQQAKNINGHTVLAVFVKK
jgi:2-polyprenyl-3-methyl-5-hydroxy-6-metoxy-1,4-benzoquinol methylase